MIYVANQWESKQDHADYQKKHEVAPYCADSVLRAACITIASQGFGRLSEMAKDECMTPVPVQLQFLYAISQRTKMPHQAVQFSAGGL